MCHVRLASILLTFFCVSSLFVTPVAASVQTPQNTASGSATLEYAITGTSYEDETITFTVRVKNSTTDRLTLSGFPLSARNISADGFTKKTTETGAEYIWNGEPSATLSYTVPRYEYGFSKTQSEHYLVPSSWVKEQSLTEQSNVNTTKKFVNTEVGYIGEKTTLVSNTNISTFTHRFPSVNKSVTFIAPSDYNIITEEDYRNRVIRHFNYSLNTWTGLNAEWSHLNVFHSGTAAKASGIAFLHPNADTSQIYITRGSVRGKRSDLYLHELFHQHQYRMYSPAFEWFGEGTADYYAEKALLNYGADSFDRFHEQVATERNISANLTTTNGVKEYTKGRHVIAALDAKIRRESNGTHSLLDVLEQRESRTWSLESFSREVREVTGVEVEAWLRDKIHGDRPSAPRTPSLYIINETADTDGDGVPNSEDFNPFEEDITTPTPEPTPTETPASDEDEDEPWGLWIWEGTKTIVSILIDVIIGLIEVVVSVTQRA